MKYSPSFHSQTDGQTEVANHNLGDLLKCLVGKLENWDLTLPRVKFAYNNSINSSSYKISFEIVHSLYPHQPYSFACLLSSI